MGGDSLGLFLGFVLRKLFLKMCPHAFRLRLKTDVCVYGETVQHTHTINERVQVKKKKKLHLILL